MPITPRQIFYVALSGIGLVVTWYWNLRFMAESGGTFSIIEFIRGGYANSASSSLSNDLVVGTIAFLTWSFAEARRLKIRHWWVFVGLTFGIAFACAYPLFLFVRERKLQAGE